MYPAQTSFIPIHITLAKYIINLGWRAFFSYYPFWYLGTTPFRYLTGPILPILLIVGQKLFPLFSLFEVMFGLIGFFWVIGGIGVYWLVRELGDKGGKVRSRGIGFLASFFFLFGPIVPFLFSFSDGLSLISFSFLPYILLFYYRYLKNWPSLKKKTGFKDSRLPINLIIMVSFLLLLDISILSTLFIGMVTVFLAQTGWKRAEKKIKSSLVFLFSSLLAVTFWYTPGYWLQVLSAPSFAGKGFFSVATMVGQLLSVALSMTLAVLSVKFFKKKNLLRDLCFYWLFIFGFLTLIRFISDPDFWLDWTAYGVELQFGIAVALCLGLSRIQKWRIIISVFCLLSSAIWASVFNKYVLGNLQPDITQTVEYRIGKQLSEIAKPNEKVFLSGSTAFWFNTFSASWRISQVRGGVDQASVDSNWRKAAWEIREGTEVEKSIDWLKKLGIAYLVVHTQNSQEFYHDFKHPEKFERVGELEKIYDKGGDRIYRLEDEDE